MWAPSLRPRVGRTPQLPELERGTAVSMSMSDKQYRATSTDGRTTGPARNRHAALIALADLVTLSPEYLWLDGASVRSMGGGTIGRVEAL